MLGPDHFRCNRCGICCRLVGKLGIPAWDREGKVKARPDGACVNLTTSGDCAIYETRPRICRVKESAPRWMPTRAAYRITEAICWVAQKVKAA